MATVEKELYHEKIISLLQEIETEGLFFDLGATKPTLDISQYMLGLMVRRGYLKVELRLADSSLPFVSYTLTEKGKEQIAA